MTRDDIKNEAVTQAVQWAIAEIIVYHVNRAYEEAAALIDGVGTLEHNDAERIRGLKIR